MKYSVLIISICVLVFETICSCGKQEKRIRDSSRQLICNIDSSFLIENLSELCDSVSFIPLETHNNSIVGVIDKIVVDTTNIYILSNNNLYIYNKRGGLDFKISQKGHAKNEYMEINDFCISHGSIYIADTQAKKILVFSKSGTYDRTIATPTFPEFIESISDSLLAISCSGLEGYRLTMLDTRDGHTKQGYFQYDKRFSSPIPQTFVRTDNNQILYKQPFSNLYYRIMNDGNIEEMYRVNFGDYTFQESDIGEINFGGSKIPYDTKGNAGILRFNESTAFFQIEFTCERLAKDAQFIALISKKNNKSYLINSDNYKDDLAFYNFRILPDFSYLFNGCLWGIIYPASWKDDVNKLKTIEKYQQYGRILEYVNSISDEQNPIVCIYHIKKSL